MSGDSLKSFWTLLEIQTLRSEFHEASKMTAARRRSDEVVRLEVGHVATTSEVEEQASHFLHDLALLIMERMEKQIACAWAPVYKHS